MWRVVHHLSLESRLFAQASKSKLGRLFGIFQLLRIPVWHPHGSIITIGITALHRNKPEMLPDDVCRDRYTTRLVAVRVYQKNTLVTDFDKARVS